MWRKMTLLRRKKMETGMRRGVGRRWRRDEEDELLIRKAMETGMRKGEGRRWRRG